MDKNVIYTKKSKEFQSLMQSVNQILSKYQEHIDRGIKLGELLKRPNITYDVLKEVDENTSQLNLSTDVCEEVEVLIKYDGYLKRQEIQVEQGSKLEKYRIPDNIDYDAIKNILWIMTIIFHR